MKKRMTVYLAGRVQGVGLRYSVQQVAAGFDVVGSVENLTDGRVLLITEGEEQELKEFLQAIEESHLAAHIRQKEVSWHPAVGGLQGFKIKR